MSWLAHSLIGCLVALGIHAQAVNLLSVILLNYGQERKT